MITNEDNNTFEFNIYTYEVTPINTETQLFEFDIKKFKSKPILQKKKNLYIIEDVVFVAENILFKIYGEETIRNEQPYYIKKYKNK